MPQNPFEVGEEKLKNVVEERRKELEKERRRLSVIYDSVAYFKSKMKDNREELKRTVDKYKSGNVREMEGWEVRMQRGKEAFNEEAYLSRT